MEDNAQKLKELYMESFPEDSEKDIEFFFKYKTKKVIANSDTSAVLYLVNKKLDFRSNIIDLPYIVALGTAVSQRGQGKASSLINKTLSILYASSVPFVALYPFNHDFYKKFNFVTIDEKFEEDQSFDLKYNEINSKEEFAKLFSQVYAEMSMKYDVKLQYDFQDWLNKINEETVNPYSMYSIAYQGKLVGCVIKGDGYTAVRLCLLDRKTGGQNVQMRIVDPIIALSSVKFKKKQSIVTIGIKDDVLGCKRVVINCSNNTVEYCVDAINVDYEVSIDELTSLVLTGKMPKYSVFDINNLPLEDLFEKNQIFCFDKY